jgi:hypothetical protein
MYSRKPETKFEILPYEEVAYYDTKLHIVDFSTYKSKITKWLDIRTENIEDNSDVDMKLSIGPEGFHVELYPAQDDNCLMSMRIDHVVALQLKQACEHYIKCYEEHRLQNDITIYKDTKLLHY